MLAALLCADTALPYPVTSVPLLASPDTSLRLGPTTQLVPLIFFFGKNPRQQLTHARLMTARPRVRRGFGAGRGIDAGNGLRI